MSKSEAGEFAAVSPAAQRERFIQQIKTRILSFGPKCIKFMRVMCEFMYVMYESAVIPDDINPDCSEVSGPVLI